MITEFDDMSDEELDRLHEQRLAEWRLSPEERHEKLKLEKMSYQDRSDYLAARSVCGY